MQLKCIMSNLALKIQIIHICIDYHGVSGRQNVSYQFYLHGWFQKFIILWSWMFLYRCLLYRYEWPVTIEFEFWLLWLITDIKEQRILFKIRLSVKVKIEILFCMIKRLIWEITRCPLQVLLLLSHSGLVSGSATDRLDSWTYFQKAISALKQ